MYEKGKQYKNPVFSHPTRIRCERCGGLDIRPNGAEYNGLVKYWKCRDCKNPQKTIGKEI